MNYFEDHIGDYAAATAHLSWDEDMAYTRLIRSYYHSEKAIPKDQAYRLARASTPAQRRAVDIVLAEFFTLQEDGYHQKRCDEEIARFKDKQRKAKASADARWSQSDRNANASANAMRTHSEGNAPSNQTPDTTTAKAVEKRASRLPAGWVLPAEWEEWARQERQDLDPTSVACKFADHWHSKPGAAGRKLDWFATWRNWVREERSPVGKAAPLKSFRQSDADAAAEKTYRMTGGLMGKKPEGQSDDFIDMEVSYAPAISNR